ncbi:putative aquaporin [Gamsiella multidivaricata]|uniref:putative aquaporin n=1 Tax=Gamsiella multidivaricata TaxID=101098 RepID=UPI00221F03DD|nr:putative aquaporin [Gamsiella multidivaricata]KAG0371389.1 glycerol channel [Gamsiella multidivaricata]KAI7824686.1 putative aquaporin [Gamsiella multidivaricata]
MSDSHHHESDPLLERAERGGSGVVRVRYEPRSKWAGVRHKFKKAFAEFLGTAILVAFGSGAIAQLVFSPNNSWFTMSLGWGLGLTFGIYVSGGISGGHLNPAVTLAQAIFRGLPWAEVPIYWISQFAGAFAGAVVVYATNYHAIRAADPKTTIGIFVTGRQTGDVSTIAAFIAEFLGTALLVLVILATSDRGNTPAGNVQPLIIGLSLAAIGNSFGWETGFALNPARDLSPRIFTAIAGWGLGAFTRQDWYFWVPIVAPFLGAIGGALTYDVFVYGGPSPLNS